MKPGGGKSKGSTFERDIAKTLNNWLNPRAREIDLWRSPSSGGMYTQNKKASNTSGDIVALTKRGKTLTDHMHWECKRYKKIDWSAIFDPKRKGVWGKIVNKTLGECPQNKVPMFVLKENGKPAFIVFQISHVGEFSIITGGWYVLELNELIKTFTPTGFENFVVKYGKKSTA